MIAKVFIGDDHIGDTDLRISDESMGGILGYLNPTDRYEFYRPNIQSLFESKGIANVDDYNLRIIVDATRELKPVGGIGIIDCVDFDEIIIESAGNERELIEKIKNEASR
jgi:hypothetical protein